MAAIIIVAASGLLDVPELRRLWAVHKGEFAIALACLLGVVFVGVLQGIIVAVILAILQIFVGAWRPHSAVLGKPEGVSGYHDLERYPDATRIPGLLMIRWDAPLIFANANLFRDFVRGLVAQTDPTPMWVLVAAEPIRDVDTTAAEMLVNLDLELNAVEIHLVFAELNDPVRDRIERYGLYETLDRRHFYPTITEAVEEFYKEVQSGSGDDPVA